MKKIIYSLAILFASSNLTAQQNVQLNIENYLGSAAYAKNTASSNNLNNTFDIRRLEYYMSNIILIHDGGKMDTFSNTYLLVNPSGALDSFNLGQSTFTNIEAIQFGIGVEAPTNNGDPTQYVTGHPLAPKSPSMHWGWSSGYRFVAVEGKCGFGLNQNYELHGLWNANYFSVRLPVNGTAGNNKTTITIKADYKQIFNNIDLSSGVIAHGTDDQDLDALANMRDSVFRNIAGETDILSTKNLKNKSNVLVYPNPVKSGQNISLSLPGAIFNKIKVYNMAGKLLQESTEMNNVRIEDAGLYLLKIEDSEGNLHHAKISIID